MSRSIEKEIFIPAKPAVVWKALTEADELVRWFPVEARVTPGLGGEIWLSWGGADAGAAPITAWEPERRFQWTESRGPIKLAVDFHLTAKDGGTVLRLVQSGFGDTPDWDDEFHMTTGGWGFFLEHLNWYLSSHAGENRHVISFREPSSLSAHDAFNRLVSALTPHAPMVLSDSRLSHQWGAVLTGFNGASVFIEIEPAKNGIRAGFWVSTFGLSAAELASARDTFAKLYRDALC
jgi:uncharacterized protein YndB with AHSA1/START domain